MNKSMEEPELNKAVREILADAMERLTPDPVGENPEGRPMGILASIGGDTPTDAT